MESDDSTAPEFNFVSRVRKVSKKGRVINVPKALHKKLDDIAEPPCSVDVNMKILYPRRKK